MCSSELREFRVEVESERRTSGLEGASRLEGLNEGEDRDHDVCLGAGEDFEGAS